MLQSTTSEESPVEGGPSGVEAAHLKATETSPTRRSPLTERFPMRVSQFQSICEFQWSERMAEVVEVRLTNEGRLELNRDVIPFVRDDLRGPAGVRVDVLVHPVTRRPVRVITTRLREAVLVERRTPELVAI